MDMGVRYRLSGNMQTEFVPSADVTVLEARSYASLRAESQHQRKETSSMRKYCTGAQNSRKPTIWCVNNAPASRRYRIV